MDGRVGRKQRCIKGIFLIRSYTQLQLWRSSLRKKRQRLVCEKCGKDLARDFIRNKVKPFCKDRNCEIRGVEQDGRIIDK
jgi:hypothetical protein